jgi:Asp-tRNA(Asn)/Glu-tRNA(Gln) amidotransferase A subunit family amidase
MNKFHKFVDIPELSGYTPRHDPTVIPKAPGGDLLASVHDLPNPRRRTRPDGFLTSADYVELYKSGVVTPLDVVQHLLPMIRRDTKPAGKYSVGWVSVREDLILEAAKASTERYKQGTPLSPLDGVLIPVKDSIGVTGYRHTQGSTSDFTGPENKTAWTISKWQEAGAIIFGITTMHEIGLDVTGVNLTYGTPRNPHNPDYYPGGSSSGSAYALAVGMAPITLGFDGGGSNRIPASFCGVYGLKPSHGRISSRTEKEAWTSVDVCGPLASNIDDLELAYRVMAQPDPQGISSYAFPSTLVEPKSQQAPKRIGVMQEWIDRSDPEVIGAFQRAVDHLVKVEGYEVVPIQIPLLPEGQRAHGCTITNETVQRITPEQTAKLTYHNQVVMKILSGRATAQAFIAMQRLRHLHMSHLAWLWEKYPGLLVLTPVATIAGWKIGHVNDLQHPGAFDPNNSLRAMEYVWLANWIGAPAISVPVGYSKEDLPIGLMVRDLCEILSSS